MNDLGKEVLRDVSRSFYLSIRLLPKAMREPIALGYLLARASDTLADTVGIDGVVRRDLLVEFNRVLNQETNSNAFVTSIRDNFLSYQNHQGEKILLARLEEIFSWLDHTDSIYRDMILRLMKKITHGQALDIERFELRDGFRISTDDELDDYCYLVAGCVGEFWSEVGDAACDNFSSLPLGQLKKLGVNYGKGLQLINILRDVPEDLKNGRSYLPNNGNNNPEELLIEHSKWRNVARAYLSDGFKYSNAIRSRRVRAGTVLPAFIGEQTLDRMDVAEEQALSEKIKIPRRQVYVCLWQSLIF